MPAGAAAACLLLAAAGGRFLPRQAAAALAAISPAAGFAAAWGAIDSTQWWPKLAWHWMLYAALANVVTTIIVSLICLQRSLPKLVAFIGGVVPLAAIWIGTARLLMPTWSQLDNGRTWWIIAISAAGLLIQVSLIRNDIRIRARELFTALFMTLVATSILMVQSGTLLFGQLTGAAASALAVPSLTFLAGHSDKRTMSTVTAATIALAVTTMIAAITTQLLSRVYFSLGEVPVVAYLLVPLGLLLYGTLRFLTSRLSVPNWLPLATLITALASALLCAVV